MSYYIVIPGNREAALRSAYSSLGVRNDTNLDEDEKIGNMVHEATATEGGQGRKLTGTNRADAVEIDTLRLGNAPWLEVVEEWPADWVDPPESD